MRRWTELHSVKASASAGTEAERDNLLVSEIKGEKPRSSFHWQRAASCMTDAFLPASALSSVTHALLKPAFLGGVEL